MSLETTGQELERTAIQVAGIAVELNAVAKDLNDFELRSTVEQTPSRDTEKWREHLRLRALGLQAKANRLALAALAAARAGEQIACESRREGGGRSA